MTAERLTGLDEERQLTYENAVNPLMRNYRAAVELTPAAGGGTLIHWHGTYSSRWGTGWLMQRFMQRMVDGLASLAAASLPPAPPPPNTPDLAS